MNTTKQASINLIEDAASAHALMNPLRLQILKNLRQPGSASKLARSLDMPRQKINYHLRLLEKNGMIEQVEERRKGNCVERIVRATAKSYLINPQALGDLATDPKKIKDKFSSTYLVAVASEAIRELAVLRQRADTAKKRLPTFTLQTEIRFSSQKDLNAFTEELAQTMARLATQYHNEETKEGRTFKFIIGSYPAITRNEEGAASAANTK